MEAGRFVSPSPPDLSLQTESCSEPQHKELRESRGLLEADCVQSCSLLHGAPGLEESSTAPARVGFLTPGAA